MIERKCRNCKHVFLNTSRGRAWCQWRPIRPFFIEVEAYSVPISLDEGADCLAFLPREAGDD